MLLSLDVIHAGTKHHVDVSAATIIKCERHFKKPAPELFGSPSIEVMAWLAWEQIRKDGTTVTPFDKWIDDLDDIEADTGDDEIPLDEIT